MFALMKLQNHICCKSRCWVGCGIGSPPANLFCCKQDRVVSCMPGLSLLDHPTGCHWRIFVNYDILVQHICICNSNSNCFISADPLFFAWHHYEPTLA